ncbi:hypothetical protein ACFXG4_48090 [Nocardia sp. NPDC059246]|uniref:hypothetical protein n=1 Tax=unclassified Nocardia TaxID=2637762 RepID=UPI003689A1AB
MIGFYGRTEPGLEEIVQALFALQYRIGSLLHDVEHDWRAAAEHPGMQHDWAQAEPELRAALLLGFAWSSRNATLPHADSPAGLYAADLHRHAREHSGDHHSFHGPGFPLLPYPGPAGALASSVAFDREDLDISLDTALLLATTDGPTALHGGRPAPGALHIPTGLPNPSNPTTPATLVMHFPSDADPEH